jgi:hypothetical protein
MKWRESFRIYLEQNTVIDSNVIKLKTFADNKDLSRCFIVANGSSIKEMDLSALRNEFVFVMNHAGKDQELIKTIKPNAHIAATSLKNFIEENRTEDDYLTMLKSTNCQIYLCHIDSKSLIESNEFFNDKDVYYFKNSNYNLNQHKEMNLKLQSPTPHMDGTLYFSLCLGTFMNFPEIYFVGCDFDHILTKTEKHFYKDSHLEAIHHRKKNVFYAYHLHNYLQKLERYKVFLNSKNVKIFNAGIGGFTDTFPKVQYKDLFK